MKHVQDYFAANLAILRQAKMPETPALSEY